MTKKVPYSSTNTTSHPFECKIIIGPPGTGKTTRIAELVSKAVSEGHNPMICSLTRAAAAVIASRNIPVHKENVGTLHSHAMAALGNPILTEKSVIDWNKSNPNWSLRGGAQGDDPYARTLDRGPALMSSLDLYRAKEVPRELWPVDLHAFAMKWQKWKDANNLVDFTDLIDLAAVNKTKVPHNCDMIFVDEAQDLSKLEQTLLHHWALQVGSLVIVGDPWQSLYVWRGANPKIFDSPKVRPENREVLSQSYRVPRAVHAAACGLATRLSDYKPIDYKPKDMDGKVRQAPFGMSFPVPVVTEADRIAKSGRSVMIAASCGYMLNAIIEELRRTSTPFANPWRTKNGRWNPLQGGRGVSMRQRIHEFLIPLFGVLHSETEDSDDVLTDNRYDIDFEGCRSWTGMEVHRWSSALAGVLERGAKRTIAGIGKIGGDRIITHDNLDEWFGFLHAGTLHKVMDGMATKIEALDWYVEHLSKDKKKPAEFAIGIARRFGVERLREPPKIFIGTFHSFKGAAADVVILLPDLSSSGWREWTGSPESRDSIIRMFYVGMTRARQELVLCQASTSRAADIWETAR